MSDALTDFILKPSAPFAAGVILFTVVWGFFKGVESVLTDATKLEIAVWLVGVKPLSPTVQPWPETFTRLFDRTFGRSHLSFRCLLRSALASILLYGLSYVLIALHNPGIIDTGFKTLVNNGHAYVYETLRSTAVNPFRLLPIFLCVAIIGDYLALLETRCVLGVVIRYPSLVVLCTGLLVDAALTLGTARVVLGLNTHFARVMASPSVDTEALKLAIRLGPAHAVYVVQSIGVPTAMALWFYPALFTSIWLWLYAGAGFLLKFARRFDIGFQWFNSKADIEHHPLSAIGLVAGALVALLYWAVAVVERVL
jgi:hypothetical protein